MKITDKIKTVNISQITPYGNNAKEHTTEQIEKIKRSISKNSYIQPIVVDQNHNIIIGHGRYEALKQLNGDDQGIEVIYVDYLTENEIKALRILDNKLNESAWIEEVLQDEIANLSLELSENEIEEMTGINSEVLGVDLGQFDENFELEKGEKDNFSQMKFTLANQQAEKIKEILFKSQYKRQEKEYFGNSNVFGNILYEVMLNWAEQKKLYSE